MAVLSSLTVHVCFRPFAGEWIAKNETVLAGLRWQGDPGPRIKLLCWDDETETLGYAREHGIETVMVPWTTHYLFPGKLRSFKLMFEAMLEACETPHAAYMNGDIVLGPDMLARAADEIGPDTLLSAPRHNWTFDGPLASPQDFAPALARAQAEPWTALDLFVFRTDDARRDLAPLPPFVLTAGSMDSWLVARAGHLGWRRRIIGGFCGSGPRPAMLHIEHAASHPFKPGADAEKRARWAFNCGVYAEAVRGMESAVLADTSLGCFEHDGACGCVADTYAGRGCGGA